MRSIGGDGGNRNVKGQGREGKSNAPQIASGTWSWNNPFLHRLCGHFTDFLDYFLHLFIFFFCDILRFLYQPWFDTGWAHGNNMLKEDLEKQYGQAAPTLSQWIWRNCTKKQTNNNKNNRKAAIWALNAKDINIFMSLCCNHVSMNGFLIYHHSKVSLLWWDLRF